RHRRTLDRLKERRKVAVHEFRRVGFVNRTLEQLPVSVMQREVEHRATNERGQPGHWLGLGSRIQTLEQLRQNMILKILPHLHRMSAALKLRPFARQQFAEFLERGMT